MHFEVLIQYSVTNTFYVFFLLKACVMINTNFIIIQMDLLYKHF